MLMKCTEFQSKILADIHIELMYLSILPAVFQSRLCPKTIEMFKLCNWRKCNKGLFTKTWVGCRASTREYHALHNISWMLTVMNYTKCSALEVRIWSNCQNICPEPRDREKCEKGMISFLVEEYI